MLVAVLSIPTYSTRGESVGSWPGRAVLSADTNVWVEELPSDFEDIFQFDLV